MMTGHTIIGIGELLWDCFGEDRRPGGAPANVAFHADQLGLNGVVVSRVGMDGQGDALLAELSAHGVSTDFIQRDSAHPTGSVTIDTTQADKPTYTIHEDVAWDYIEFDAALASAADCASAICFGTLAQRSTKSRETILRCLDSNPDALPIYDVNLRAPWYKSEWIRSSLTRCRVAKLNDEEVPVVARLLDWPAAELAGFALALQRQFDIEVVCITRGENGCLLCADGDCAEVPGRRVDIIDTVGAGDAFTAALVGGLLWKWPLADIARFANEVGARVAGRRGAMPSMRKELQELRDRVAPIR